MKKTLIVLASIFCLSSAVFAQMSVDPQDEFYEYAEIWRTKGIVSEVPLIRPYPYRNIVKILNQVIENGQEMDVEIAQEMLENLTSRKLRVQLAVEGAGKVSYSEKSDPYATDIDSSDDFDGQFLFNPAVVGDVSFLNDYVSMGYNLGFNLRTDNYEKFVPSGTNFKYDSFADASNIGPLKMYYDMNDSLAFGNDMVFGQIGVNRTGYGPYISEGLALNESSFHAGNINIGFVKGKLAYGQQISAIGATRTYDSDIGSLHPDKFLAFHAIEYDASDRLTVGFYESSVFGGRFDFTYIAPVPFMIVQSLGGCADNINMGLMFKVRPMKGMLWATDIMIDDFDVNAIAKLKFDSKFRIAAKTGLAYTPDNSFVKRIDVNYTLITPYTYSHWQYDNNTECLFSESTLNYQNYTNTKSKIGSQYEPNSDAFSIGAKIKPVKRVTIDFKTKFIRHCNVAESVDDSEALVYLASPDKAYATDGTVNNHTMFMSQNSDGVHVDTAWSSLNLFTQAHKKITVQSGIDFRYDFPQTRKHSNIAFKMGCLFEFIHNDGIDNNIYSGNKVVAIDYDGNAISPTMVADKWSQTYPEYGMGIAAFEYNGVRYTPAEYNTLVQIFKDQWIAQLRNTVNFYFNAGISVRL